MKKVLLGIFLTLFVAFAYAKQKTVGVVMSGGGAKGLYHIGVLQALEENNIPIDYVAGTSMGAIIAGFYAAGYSVEEIAAIAQSDEIAQWAQGEIDPSYGYYYQSTSTLMRGEAKLNFRANLNREKLEFSSTIAQGLVSTTPVDMALSSMFAQADEVSKGDFNKLMVPFFCVTSDVTANKAHVLDRGNLGLALRSSMSLPLMYKPIVDDNGHIYYDGGLFDNFPTRPMMKIHNPDLLIGSHCDINGEDLNSANLKLSDQVMMLLTKRSAVDMPENGVLIAGHVPGSIMDFENASKIIAAGYRETMDQMDEIRERLGADNLQEEGFYEQRRDAFNMRKKELKIGSYEIDGLSEYQQRYAERYIKHMSKDDFDDRELSFDELERNLYTILSTRNFDTEFPVIKYNDRDMNFDFNIKMEQKPPLRFAVDAFLSSTPYNQLYLGAEYFSVGRSAKRLTAELFLGSAYTTSRLSYRQDFFLHTPVFIDTYLNFTTQRLDLGNFSNVTPVNNISPLKESDMYYSIGLGSPLKRRAQVLLRSNLGMDWLKYDNYYYITAGGNSFSDKARLAYWATMFEVDFSTLNNTYDPTSGSQIKASVINVAAEERLQLTDFDDNLRYTYDHINHHWLGVRLNLLHYFSSLQKRHFSLGIMGEAVYTTIEDMTDDIVNTRYLPRFTPTMHSRMLNMPEYSSSKYISAGLMSKSRLWKHLYFDAQFYGMLSPALNDVGMKMDDEWSAKYITQAGFEYRTSLGPVSVSAAKYGIEDWDNMYVYFNFGYMIFSPRGTFY